MTHRMHMPHEIEALEAKFHDSYQAKAERLLRIPDAVYRAFIPERLPLEPSAYLVRRCPACGVQDPKWARLVGSQGKGTWASSNFAELGDDYWDNVDLDAPQRLACNHCETQFPSADFPESAEEYVGEHRYPYWPGPNGERYYFTAFAEYYRMKSLGYRDIFYPLCIAYHCTGDDAYAAKAIALLAIFADRLSGWPYLGYQASKIAELRGAGIHVLSADQLGQAYGGWYISWGGSYMVTEWTLGYDLIADSAAATPEAFAMIRDRVIKPVLEAQVYPIHTYFLDKFHNSTTNHYRAIAGAAHVFGDGLVVEDIVRQSFRLSGGDIAQDLLWGAKGVRQFIQNCFDATGLYSERTSGYQEYAAYGILTTLTYLRHYSDPAGYTPGESVAHCYRPITDFRIEKDLPIAARPLHALFDFLHSDGLFYILGDSQRQYRTMAQVQNLVRRCPDARIHAWAESAEDPNATDPWPPTHDVLSQDFGLAICRSTDTGQPTFSLSWTPHGDYHSHFDSLHITYRAFGQTLFPDPNTNYASPFRHLWIDRTLAHSTVSVGDERQLESSGGSLRLKQSGCLADFIAVSDPSVYSEVTCYERTVVNIGGNAPYAVDLFTCAGATDYTQSWLGGSTAFSAPVLADSPTLARTIPDYSDPSWWDRGAAKMDMANGREALAVTGEARITETASTQVSWRLDDVDGQLILGLQQGDTLTAATCPFDILESPPTETTVLLHSRTVEAAERTHFLAAYRLTREATPFAMERREIPGGIWARVDQGDRCDHVFFRTGNAPLRCDELDLSFDGQLLLVRYVGDHVCALQGSGGTRLQIGTQTWSPQRPALSVTIHAVDIAATTLDVVTTDTDLADRLLYLTHSSGHTSVYPIVRSESLAADRQRLWLDRDLCKLYTHSGLIDPRSTARELVTPTVAPEPFLPGSHVYTGGAHIGPVADATCTGDPLRITGVTANSEPRALRISLAAGALPADAPGHEFYISHVAAGDRGQSPSIFDWSGA